MSLAREALSARIAAALQRAAETNHRETLVFSGSADWTGEIAAHVDALLQPLDAVWLTNRPIASTPLPSASAHRLLGQDLGILIYDAHSGFDPDGFGAATGAIRGGGLLILLTPPFEDWPRQPDPQAERIAVWPHSAESIGGRFLSRLVNVLRDAPGINLVSQDEHLQSANVPMAEQQTPRLRFTARAEQDIQTPRTADQAQAIEAIIKTAQGRARRPLVITAHRGRGKSAALGLAAARLILTARRRLLVTAPRRSSADTLFKHAQALLDAAQAQTGNAAQRAVGMEFRSPAELADEAPAADLLLVDEAASIPAPLLTRLLQHYPRIIFASTVHGYEGTGRGFEIRFRQTLDRLTPNWHRLTLESPIRWSANDPLEALTFRALLLDAGPAPDAAVAPATPDNCELQRFTADDLVDDEARLRELFGLLVLAHYQTRPMDLRMLLDGPNVRVYVLRHAGAIVATLLGAEEGGFDDHALREAIFTGRRRPRGHLLPQTLSAHAGLFEAPSLQYLRVVRIAVHPAASRRGLGRALMAAVEEQSRQDGFDLIGASFGATPELLDFWKRCGYRVAQIGTSRNAASGEHAAVVARGISEAGLDLVQRAQRQLEARLSTLLAGPLRALDPFVATSLACALPAPQPGDPELSPLLAVHRRELLAFIEGYRTLETTLPLLAELTRLQLRPTLEEGRINLADGALLISATRQLRPMADLVQHFEANGKGGILDQLRKLAALLMPTNASVH